jgi:hypothetical protein
MSELSKELSSWFTAQLTKVFPYKEIEKEPALDRYAERNNKVIPKNLSPLPLQACYIDIVDSKLWCQELNNIPSREYAHSNSTENSRKTRKSVRPFFGGVVAL